MPFYMRTLLVTATPDELAKLLEERRSHIAGLRAEGKLRISAEFVRGDGFVEIFEATDLLEADRIARSDPLIEAGLGTWMMRELERLE
jgi:uncharacterized protein YciI